MENALYPWPNWGQLYTEYTYSMFEGQKFIQNASKWPYITRKINQQNNIINTWGCNNINFFRTVTYSGFRTMNGFLFNNLQLVQRGWQNHGSNYQLF